MEKDIKVDNDNNRERDEETLKRNKVIILSAIRTAFKELEDSANNVGGLFEKFLLLDPIEKIEEAIDFLNSAYLYKEYDWETKKEKLEKEIEIQKFQKNNNEKFLKALFYNEEV
jgi:hypothetical protein